MAAALKHEILEKMKSLNEKHRSIDSQIRGGPYRRSAGNNNSSPRGRGNIRDRLGPRVSPRLGNNRLFAERGLRGNIRRRGANVPLRTVRGDNRHDRSPTRINGLASASPRKRRLMSSVANKDDDDDADDENATGDAEDKESDATTSETPPVKKKKVQRRDRRMFGNLMAHLGRARKDLTKNRKVTEIREKVEKQVIRKQNEEKQKLRELESTMNLEKKEELKKKKLEVLKEKDKLRQKLMEIEWQEHRTALGKFLQTKTKPHIFFVPAKHNDKTKEMLEQRKKQVAAEVELAIKATNSSLEEDSKKDDGNKDADDNDNVRKKGNDEDSKGNEDENVTKGKEDEKEASADDEENNADKTDNEQKTEDKS